MPDQIGNTSLASAGRNKNSVMQPATASGSTSQIPGALKGRVRCLSLILNPQLKSLKSLKNPID